MAGWKSWFVTRVLGYWHFEGPLWNASQTNCQHHLQNTGDALQSGRSKQWRGWRRHTTMKDSEECRHTWDSKCIEVANNKVQDVISDFLFIFFSPWLCLFLFLPPTPLGEITGTDSVMLYVYQEQGEKRTHDNRRKDGDLKKQKQTCEKKHISEVSDHCRLSGNFDGPGIRSHTHSVCGWGRVHRVCKALKQQLLC